LRECISRDRRYRHDWSAVVFSRRESHFKNCPRHFHRARWIEAAASVRIASVRFLFVWCFFLITLGFWHQTTVKVEVGRQFFFNHHLLSFRGSRILVTCCIPFSIFLSDSTLHKKYLFIIISVQLGRGKKVKLHDNRPHRPTFRFLDFLQPWAQMPLENKSNTFIYMRIVLMLSGW